MLLFVVYFRGWSRNGNWILWRVCLKTTGAFLISRSDLKNEFVSISNFKKTSMQKNVVKVLNQWQTKQSAPPPPQVNI